METLITITSALLGLTCFALVLVLGLRQMRFENQIEADRLAQAVAVEAAHARLAAALGTNDVGESRMTGRRRASWVAPVSGAKWVSP